MSDPSTGDGFVAAAGGVVLHDREDGLHVLAVHRPKYDDWSLPKGKLDDGEAYEQAALREVDEETGVRARLLRELSSTSYRDRDDRLKHVRWWAMTIRHTVQRPPDDEVDAVTWVPVAEMPQRLTYPADVSLVSEALDAEPGRTSLLVLRHVHAGDRSSWRGDDRDRPVSDKGRAQAQALVDHLDDYAVTRIVTSPYTRCVQSVEPLAAERDVPVVHDERLAEGNTLATTLGLLGELDSGTVICSHGDVIGDLITHLDPDEPDPSWKKASTWAVTVDRAGRLVAGRYLPPPGTSS